MEAKMTGATPLGEAGRQRRGLGATARRVIAKPQFWFGCAILVPLTIYYAWFSFGPILRAFWMATVDYQVLNPAASPFVGLRHFRQLFHYSLFWPSVKNTLIYTVMQYLFLLPPALLISVCLTSLTRGRNLYQFIIFLPVVVSYVAIALLFRMLMDPQTGQFNQILRALHLPTSRFLNGPESALPSVALVDGWKGVGFYVVILTAGMLNIPQEMYDAAKVDGAGAWARLWHVTLPLLGHTLALVSVLIVMGGLQAFTQVAVLAQAGGPGTSTYTVNLLVYQEAFESMRFGFATAAAFTLFLFIFVITLIQLKLLRPTWSY
jgi:ABC-type sugar transport system permease subunit